MCPPPTPAGDLAKHGFVWQFITLAGFHSNGLITHSFAQAYAERGMGAYVEMIQREERRTGTPVLKHQGWSAAEPRTQCPQLPQRVPCPQLPQRVPCILGIHR